jgi:hypothetical protein
MNIKTNFENIQFSALSGLLAESPLQKYMLKFWPYQMPNSSQTELDQPRSTCYTMSMDHINQTGRAQVSPTMKPFLGILKLL